MLAELTAKTDIKSATKYEIIIQLFKSGFSINEIAERVYGEDNYRNRQRVRMTIYLYGKRLGLLKGNIVYDRFRGEFIESQSGLVVERELRADFVEHSCPVPPQAPFLGGYSNVVQLKASLSREDMVVYRALEYVDSFLALIHGLSRESVIRQSACLLVRGNRSLIKKKGAKVVAAACVAASVAYHAPRRLSEFLVIIEHADNIGRDSIIDVISDGSFWLPYPMAASLAREFLVRNFTE